MIIYILYHIKLIVNIKMEKYEYNRSDEEEKEEKSNNNESENSKEKSYGSSSRIERITYIDNSPSSECEFNSTVTVKSVEKSVKSNQNQM